MPTVRAERTIAAPIEQVFDRLTDHASYKDFPGVRSSELIREGQADRNGLGAMRRIEFGPIRFEEEIMAFDRPRRMDYLIREVNVPMKHEGGRMEFEAVDGGTRVVWTSAFTGTVPGIGGLLGGARSLGPDGVQPHPAVRRPSTRATQRRDGWPPGLTGQRPASS